MLIYLDSDRIDGFNRKQWSRWDDGPDPSCAVNN